MKKTLITLAALAAASVAQADSAGLGQVLDFTDPTTLPQDGAKFEFKGNADDKIVLNGESSFIGNNEGSSITSGGVTVKTDRLFTDHSYNPNYGVLNGATIVFGLDGKLTGAQINLGNQNLTFSLTLDFTIEVEDESLIGKTVIMKRQLMDIEGGIWNREGNGNSYTLSVSSVDDDAALQMYGITLSEKTAAVADSKRKYEIGTATSADNGGYGDYSTIDTAASGISAGTWQFYNATDNDISVAYAVTYVAKAPAVNVPEPTTATLSLLALAGLAARRRRK